MRTLFVVSLALVLVALPAAQAAACRCIEEGPTDDAAATCCCCEPLPEDCCCGSGGDPATQRLERDCICSMPAPQSSEPPVIQVPAPAAADETAATEPVSLAAVGRQQDLGVGRDPHPEVLLPLLL